MTSDPTCESVLVAAMAIADGERPPIAPDLVAAHLSGCASCRADASALDATRELLDRCQRRPASGDLWPAVSRRIGAVTTPAPSSDRAVWATFLALALGLVGARVLLAAAPDFPIAIKLLAAALAVATFAVVRENPFKIDPGLRLGQE